VILLSIRFTISLKALTESDRLPDCGSSNEADMKVYAEQAVYDDLQSYYDTRYKIAGQWYGLPKFFSKLDTKKLEVVEDSPTETV
jgi:hypothetical protein